MNIYISGASGFIGSNLSVFLKDQGHTTTSIPRNLIQGPTQELAHFIKDIDVLINLSGAPVVGRWSESYKKTLTTSRIDTTKKLFEACSLNKHFPKSVFNASAVGIYEKHYVQSEEKHQYANGFLADLVKDWESEALKFGLYSKVYLLRFGSVLGNGGALNKMLPVFRLGLGATLGHGKQFMPWIHIKDVQNIIHYLIKNDSRDGTYNFVAPDRVTNKLFSKTLANTLNRPLLLKVPPIILRLLFGNGAEILINGQEVIPQKLEDINYKFLYPQLKEALDDILK